MNAYRSHEITDSHLSLLRPEDANRHREAAWRYIWARNPAVASRLWQKYRPGEMPPTGCELTASVREAA